jgi:hypothetical protein
VGDYQDKNTFAAQQCCNAIGNALLPRLPLRNAEKCAGAQTHSDRMPAVFFARKSKKLAGG